MRRFYFVIAHDLWVHFRLVMGRKRKNSQNNITGLDSKTTRNGGSPENGVVNKKHTGLSGPKQGFSVSDTLRSVRSTLFVEDLNGDMDLFSTPPASPSRVAKSKSVAENVYVSSNGVSSKNRSEGDSSVLEYLKKMDLKLTSMDKKLEKLDILEKKVCGFETEMNKMWTFIHESKKESEQGLHSLSEKSDHLEFSLGLAVEKITSLEKDKDRLKDDLLYIQSQSMRNNLIFGNIPEKDNERSDETESILRGFMVDKLKIAEDLVRSIHFERVHRTGRKSERMRHRHIVAKFSYFKDRETVRRQAKHLNHTEYFLFEQYPREIADKRKTLVPQMKDAIKSGHKAWLSYDKLYIDGNLVRNSVGKE